MDEARDQHDFNLMIRRKYPIKQIDYHNNLLCSSSFIHSHWHWSLWHSETQWDTVSDTLYLLASTVNLCIFSSECCDSGGTVGRESTSLWSLSFNCRKYRQTRGFIWWIKLNGWLLMPVTGGSLHCSSAPGNGGLGANINFCKSFFLTWNQTDHFIIPIFSMSVLKLSGNITRANLSTDQSNQIV